MNTISLVKEIYREGFRNLGSKFAKNYFKVFAVFGFSMYLVTLYALIFRVSTGFAFQ